MFFTILFTYFYLLLAIPRTETHLTYPINYCNMASTCTHDSTAVCGTSSDGCQRRAFLDICDMYEYNCDNKAEFVTKAASPCTNGRKDFTC